MYDWSQIAKWRSKLLSVWFNNFHYDRESTYTHLNLNTQQRIASEKSHLSWLTEITMMMILFIRESVGCWLRDLEYLIKLTSSRSPHSQFHLYSVILLWFFTEIELVKEHIITFNITSHSSSSSPSLTSSSSFFIHFPWH